MVNVTDTAILLSIPVITGILGALIAKIAQSPQAAQLASATAMKLAAEARHLEAEADATNNALLADLVHQAMTYAENHSDVVLTQFHTKADYVIHVVEQDPRFGGMGVGLDAIEHLIEQVYSAFFADVEHGDEPPAPPNPPAPPSA